MWDKKNVAKKCCTTLWEENNTFLIYLKHTITLIIGFLEVLMSRKKHTCWNSENGFPSVKIDTLSFTAFYMDNEWCRHDGDSHTHEIVNPSNIH